MKTPLTLTIVITHLPQEDHPWRVLYGDVIAPFVSIVRTIEYIADIMKAAVKREKL
jgi:hypothetical protein